MEIREGLTFDDVLLQPRASDILPADAKLKTRLTRDIEINVPLVSAAMDTVTEAPLAITMAQTGGIGVIHRNLSIEEQAEEARALLHKHRIERLLVVDSKFRCVGLITVKDMDKAESSPNACKDAHGRLRVAAASTVGDAGFERCEALIEAGVDALVIDTAHGHSIKVIDQVKRLKKAYPKVQVIAGNIATENAAKALIKAGADALKVGIGPGSICTTRIVAGVGVPQLTAIMDVCKAAKKAGVPVIADGGIKYSGIWQRH